MDQTGYQPYGYVPPAGGQPQRRRSPWRVIAWSVAIMVMMFCLVVCGVLVAGAVAAVHQDQQQQQCLARLPVSADPARCLP